MKGWARSMAGFFGRFRYGMRGFASVAAVWLCLGGLAEAAITDCSNTDPNTPTAWSNFSGANGFILPYTFAGQPVRDTEGDSTPSTSDISSGAPNNNPGMYDSARIGYYDGGTPYVESNPSTLEDDYLFFSIRLGGNPASSSGEDFQSGHWNVLFDMDGDGYKEFWVDVNGGYNGTNGTGGGKKSYDAINIFYNDSNKQSITSDTTELVGRFCAYNSDAYSRSHTRVVAATDGSGEFTLEMQVPLTAFNDLNGNQMLYPDSPVGIIFTTGTSATNPMQKDFMADVGYTADTDPVNYGDTIKPNGKPILHFADSLMAERDFYTVGDNIYAYLHAQLANTNSTTIQTLAVAISDPATGDDESVTLTESGPNTGIFTNLGGATVPVSSNVAKAWIPYVATGANAVTENWTATYSTATSRWTLSGSVSGAQATTVQAGVAYTADHDQVGFTLYHDGTPANGATITFSTQGADPLPSGASSGADDDGTLQVASGDTITVSYSSASFATSVDTADIVGVGEPYIQFTRSNGMASDHFELGVDKLYVTVYNPGANTNAGTVQTITVSLTTPGSSEAENSFTLTETGVNTGIFRNATGLTTAISDGTITPNDNLWEASDQGQVTASYTYGSTTYTTTVEVFYIAKGGRSYFVDMGGTENVDNYLDGDAVFARVIDRISSVCVPTGDSPQVATISSEAGDSETITLYPIHSGAGVYINRRNDLVTTAGSATVSAATMPSGLTAGGRFIIATGPDLGSYTIHSQSGTSVTLTTPLTATRTDIGYHASPLVASTYDGAYHVNDNLLEANPGDLLTLSYTDCDDGDSDGANNNKLDYARFFPSVVVEPNGASSATAGSTLIYPVTVRNEGKTSDTYDITLHSELGWKMELVNPSNGALINTDTNGDGTWDSGLVSVYLDPESSSPATSYREYWVRVTVPGGAAPGTMDSRKVTATSESVSRVKGDVRLETRVVSGSALGTVLWRPDQSAVADAGDTLVYRHQLTNNTGSTRTFDLKIYSEQGWTVGIYADTNGNGSYDSGTDLAATNSGSMANGTSKWFFVKVSVAGTAGTIELTHVGAVAQNDTLVRGTVVDTTTVRNTSLPQPIIGVDLSGGGTQTVSAGQTAIFPGTLVNTGNATANFTFTLTPSDNLGDGFAHPTALYIDTAGSGVPVLAATDTDGDGDWDTGTAAFNGLGAGLGVAYELRRTVDAGQTPYRDPVTLTATNCATGKSDSITAVNELFGPTLAEIGSFSAYTLKGQVVVQWETLSEHGTLGFRLRRDAGDGVFDLTEAEFLPGMLISPVGGIYRWVDRDAQPGRTYRYELVELESGGAERIYGPFEVSARTVLPDQEGADALAQSGYFKKARPIAQPQSERIAAKQKALNAGQKARSQRRGSLLKLPVREEGIYRIDAQTLADAMGVSLDEAIRRLAGNRIGLSSGGEPVAVEFKEGNKEKRGGRGGDALLFFGEGLDTVYTGTNVYRLEITDRVAKVGQVRGKAPEAAVAEPQQFVESVTAAQNLYSVMTGNDPEADYWMWEYIMPYWDVGSRDFAVQSPGAIGGGTAKLRVRLLSQYALNLAAQPDHHALVTLNGHALGDIQWSGVRPYEMAFDVPSDWLVDGDNQVRVQGVRNPNVFVSLFHVNDFRLEYPRRMRATGNRLAFNSEGYRQVTVGGFTENGIRIYELADRRHPRRVRARVDADPAGGFRASFFVTPHVDYYAVSTAGLRTLDSVQVDIPSTLMQEVEGAEYLLIAPSHLTASATRLAEYRAGQGLSTRVVDLEDIYDEFSYGIVDPEAIRRFLAHAWNYWNTPPAYAVLVGEGSYDYRNYTGFGDSLVPPLMVGTPDGLFVSDNPYADLEGNDGAPELALGRIPVIDGLEFDTFLDKLVAYEQGGGPSGRTAVVGADRDDGRLKFYPTAEALAERFPYQFRVDRAFAGELGDGGARAAFLRALGYGRDFVAFAGHGSYDTLGNAQLLLNTDLPALEGSGHTPVVSVITCLAADYGYPQIDSLGESLVLLRDGGASAVWGPSGFSQNHRALRLAEGFYDALFQQGEERLGDALMEGKRRYALDGVDGYLLDLYNLLGDPAMRVDGWQ